MAYKQEIFANNGVYHVFNRGIEKKIVFEDKKDLDRFIEALDYYRLKNLPGRFSFRKRPTLKKIPGSNIPLVEILCFCLMPNHFHLLLKQTSDWGVSKFLSKVTNSYTKYFNTKYKRIGPLFRGTFKAVRIENDEQLIHVSRFIHLNPLVGYIVRDLKKFSFSSYLQYIGLEESFCKIDHVLSHFKDSSDYQKFVLDQEDYARSIKQMERLMLENRHL